MLRGYAPRHGVYSSTGTGVIFGEPSFYRLLYLPSSIHLYLGRPCPSQTRQAPEAGRRGLCSQHACFFLSDRVICREACGSEVYQCPQGCERKALRAISWLCRGVKRDGCCLPVPSRPGVYWNAPCVCLGAAYGVCYIMMMSRNFLPNCSLATHTLSIDDLAPL